jgi:phage shock protein A
MPELEILEAKVPVRTPCMARQEQPASLRAAPAACWLSGPVFSRARDIFAANMTELLDRAEDPARMIRMIILEMEDTLVDIRATAARSIADIKEMRRAVARLDEIEGDWTAKAELALSKDREDLAKAALVERQKAGEMAQGLRSELEQMEQVLRGYEGDIARLQAKLREARARQNAIAARFECALTRARTLRADASAVQLDEVLRDRHAQSQPGLASRRRAVSLPEAFEDVGQKLRRDTLSRVAHGDLDARIHARQTNLHAAAPRSELDRVRQQIPHHLLQAFGVAGDGTRLRVEN